MITINKRFCIYCRQLININQFEDFHSTCFAEIAAYKPDNIFRYYPDAVPISWEDFNKSFIPNLVAEIRYPMKYVNYRKVHSHYDIDVENNKKDAADALWLVSYWLSKHQIVLEPFDRIFKLYFGKRVYDYPGSAISQVYTID